MQAPKAKSLSLISDISSLLVNFVSVFIRYLVIKNSFRKSLNLQRNYKTPQLWYLQVCIFHFYGIYIAYLK